MSEDAVVRRELRGRVAIVTLARAEKRNALSRGVFHGLRAAFADLPEDVRAVVLAGEGAHFCAGLDLTEHKTTTPFPSMLYSREWHKLVQGIRDCGRPVVTAMQGAVIGGGLEMACCTHVRVAEADAFYQLPEARRGIFIGGGGSVSIAEIIGAGRLTEMMLTGRRLSAEEGQALGLSHYLVEPGQALPKALELAEHIAGNAPISTYMTLNAIRLIASMPAEAGLFTESVAQALTLTSEDAEAGMNAFLQKKTTSF